MVIQSPQKPDELRAQLIEGIGCQQRKGKTLLMVLQ
jgi:hypothetical protein